MRYHVYMSEQITGCIEVNPTSQSVNLGGVYINLSVLARTQNIDQSYLSRIMAGKRRPRIDHAQKIAGALGITIDRLLELLDDRKKYLDDQARATHAAYKSRVAREDAEDRASGFQIPRLPGLHLSAQKA